MLPIEDREYYSYADLLVRSGVVLKGQTLDSYLEYILNHLPEHLGMSELMKLMHYPHNNPNVQDWREAILRWRSPDGIKSGPIAHKFMQQHYRCNVAASEAESKKQQ